MNFRRLWLLILMVGCFHSTFAADNQTCPVTKLPEKPFVAPEPYGMGPVLGTADLWTFVRSGHFYLHDARKLPFFRVGFDARKEGRPRLTVVARRLDETGPLVWDNGAGSGITLHSEIHFMVTGLDLPSPGCWEFTAHYAPSWDYVQNLSFVVWVER